MENIANGFQLVPHGIAKHKCIGRGGSRGASGGQATPMLWPPPMQCNRGQYIYTCISLNTPAISPRLNSIFLILPSWLAYVVSWMGLAQSNYN
jgi:hypothetical protein